MEQIFPSHRRHNRRISGANGWWACCDGGAASFKSPTLAGFHYTWRLRMMFWGQRHRHGQELEPVRLWGRPAHLSGAISPHSAAKRAS